jgi:hypothetical protein
MRRRVSAGDDQAQKRGPRVQAEQDQKTYDALNYRDDQFDLSDALVALAISLWLTARRTSAGSSGSR